MRQPTKLLKNIKKIVLFSIASFFLCSILWVFMYKFINPPFTSLMIIKYFDASKDKRSIIKQWSDIKDISKYMVLATIAAEDQKFIDHHGFDFDQINISILEFEEKGRFRGASTISQQTAKNVFLFPSRSWIRKGLESYFTLLIELMWSKKRIIEVYLNVAEMGQGIYGVEAAANSFFGKKAKNLTQSEAAYLASLLPNPIVYRSNNSQNLVRRQKWIIMQMNNLGGVSYLTSLYE